jgi:hypothetical protein
MHSRPKQRGGKRPGAGRPKGKAEPKPTPYGVNERTLRRWKADGAPLDDEKAMQAWFATRKNLPKSVLEQLRLPTVSAKRCSQGAAGALQRLNGTPGAHHRR